MAGVETEATALDLMQQSLICVRDTDTLFDALEQMTENHVTGIPVLDRADRCVGLVSASDILDVEQDVDGAAESGRFYDPDTGRWEDVATTFHRERLSEIRVSEVMSRDLLSVEPETPLVAVCTSLAANNVHRLLVIDEKLQLRGIISSMDVVRWVSDAGSRS